MTVVAKKDRKKAKVKQTDEGVQVTRPDRVLRKVGPERAVSRRPVPPVRCPYCVEEGREGNAKRITGAKGVSYYECLECCDREKGEPTTFKVLKT